LRNLPQILAAVFPKYVLTVYTLVGD
jgi:hypothetical protein